MCHTFVFWLSIFLLKICFDLLVAPLKIMSFLKIWIATDFSVFVIFNTFKINYFLPLSSSINLK